MGDRTGIDRREFLAGSAATALAPKGLSAAASRPASILVILADQLTWWMADPAQRGALDLPNIDRLRAEGTVFERCYSNSPYCPPARMLLRNGRFPHANPGGLALLQPADSIEARLQAAGLVTRYLGKWHLSPHEELRQYVHPTNRLNWDWFVGHERSHNKLVTYVQNDPTPISTAPWDPQVMTDFAIRLLREDHAKDRPFLMQVNYLPPHQPYTLYPPNLALYKPKNVKLRPNVLLDPAGWRTTIAHYMNLVRGVDIEVGRLLAELDSLGGDVVVVFASDHGDMLGSQGLEYKRKPFEEAVRVPLIVRGPGWLRTTVSYPVGLVDVVRTLADVGQGIDLRYWRDSVYLEMPTTPEPWKNWSAGEWRGVVTDDGWKLAIGSGGMRVMFDLLADPYELRDLAGRGDPREAELETRTRDWADELGDPYFTP